MIKKVENTTRLIESTCITMVVISSTCYMYIVEKKKSNATICPSVGWYKHLLYMRLMVKTSTVYLCTCDVMTIEPDKKTWEHQLKVLAL